MIKHLQITKNEEGKFIIQDPQIGERVAPSQTWKSTAGATSWLRRTNQPFLIHLPTGRTTAYNCENYDQTHGSLDALLCSFLNYPIGPEQIQRALELLRGDSITPQPIKKGIKLEPAAQE